MNREEMIRDTEEKLEALRAGYEEYLLMESMLKWLKRPSGEVGRPLKGTPSIKDFILDVMSDGKPHLASEVYRLLSEDPSYAWREITKNSIYSRVSTMARDGYLVKLRQGEGYKIAPDKEEK